MALYTAAGQYHSGKYFWSREGSEPPVVTIAYYVPSVLVAPTPGPGATSTPTAPTVTPTAPTATPPAPTATPRAPTATPTALPVVTATPAPAAAAGCKYYVAIGGKDSNAGTTLATAWATFRRAWDSLYPGDTLCIGDGTYTEPIQPVIRNGEPGKPITIRAINDGRVTIDGQGKNIPVRLGENWGPNGPIGDWFVVEGIVARNGTIATLRIEHGNNNVLRRVLCLRCQRR
jgi:hypothetical protein